MDEKIEQIFHAIKMTVEELDSQAELAKRANLNKVYIHRFLKGKAKTMEMEMFLRLYPHIKKHLPLDFFANTECEKICAGLGNMEKGFMKDFKLYSKEEKARVWKLHDDIEEERLKKSNG